MNMAIMAEALKEHIPEELSVNNIVNQYKYWHYKMEVEREMNPKWYAEALLALEEYKRKNGEES